MCCDPENRKPSTLVFCLWFRNPQNPVLKLLSVKSVGLFAARVYPPRSGILLFPSPFAISDFKLQARGFLPLHLRLSCLSGLNGFAPCPNFPFRPISPCRFRLYPLICVPFLLRSVSHRSLVFLRSTWCSCDFCDCLLWVDWFVLWFSHFPVCPVPRLPIGLWFVFFFSALWQPEVGWWCWLVGWWCWFGDLFGSVLVILVGCIVIGYPLLYVIFCDILSCHCWALFSCPCLMFVHCTGTVCG